MKWDRLIVGRRRGAALNFCVVGSPSHATASASLRSPTFKLGQSGSFALPLFVTVWLCVCSFAAFAADTNALAKLQNVHRIVFLGDSITYAGGYVADVEAYYITRFPDRHFEFINVGLSSETVSGLSEASETNPRPDLHERLGRVLEKTKPDLTFICYGMNDGIYHPSDAARFKAFQDGMKSVHEQIAATGAKIIHVTPPVFDPVGAKARISTNAPFGFGHPFWSYNQTLDQFSEWLVAQRPAGWDVADLHSGMNRWLADERQRDSNFNFTRDGVHPDNEGHWIMAKQILIYLGAKDVENVNGLCMMQFPNPNCDDIMRLVRQKEELLRDAWLNFCGFNRPGIKAGLPVPEAEAKAAELDKQIRELVK
jgi:lysophospholipase L1-like esterase